MSESEKPVECSTNSVDNQNSENVSPIAETSGHNIDAKVENSEITDKAMTPEMTMTSEESFISVGWLGLSGGSSNALVPEKNEPEASKSENLRIQLYEPPKSLTAIVEASKVGLVMSLTQQVQIEAPKVELITDLTCKALVEAPCLGILTIEEKASITETMINQQTGTLTTSEPQLDDSKADSRTQPAAISDDDENQSNKDVYESPEDANDTNDQPLLSAIDSRCCTRRLRERETQTPKSKSNTPRERKRVAINGNSSGQLQNKSFLAATSSDCGSSEAPRKLTVKVAPQNTFKQRQLELHRHRILVEQRRLELLELKIARERDEMLRNSIQHQKELEIKSLHLRRLNEDRMFEI